jgi:hypothetical protein
VVAIVVTVPLQQFAYKCGEYMPKIIKRTDQLKLKAVRTNFYPHMVLYSGPTILEALALLNLAICYNLRTFDRNLLTV